MSISPLRKFLALLTSAACAVFLIGLSATPASAAVGLIQLTMTTPAQIRGHSWPTDELLDVCRGDQSLGEVTPDAGEFTFPLNRAARVGEVYTVVLTGNCTNPVESVSVVATLALTSVDVAEGWIYGRGGEPGEVLRVSVGGPYGAGSTYTEIRPNPDGSWAAYTGPDAFDLMKGVGISLFQFLPEGHSVQATFPVPNPMISIWDTHGVAARGWKPNTPLRLSLTNPSDGETYEWTVTTDSDGNFWDVPPDEAWQVLQPGWIATGTGSVDGRESATLTKTLTLPDPLPLPDSMAANVVSGTLPGTLSAQTVGPGSLLNVTAACRANDWPQRSALADPTTGEYSLSFTTAATPPWGTGVACAEQTHYYGVRILDLDGDEVSVNWLVTPDPEVLVPDVVYNGQDGEVTGGGWDLMAVEISQCQMSGTDVVGCDPATTLVKNDYPDPLWDQYPQGYAQFEENITFQRYLDIAGQTIDCATTSCAVVVTEPNRVGIRAFAPLTYGFDPFIEVSPWNNLLGGEQLTVRGSDFPPNATFPIDIAQGYGSAEAGLVDHDTWLMGSVTTNGEGSFSVTINASRQLHVSPMPVDPKLDIDCATVSPAGNDRCGVYAYWTVIPTDPGRDTAEFFIPLGYQPPAGTQGPPGVTGPPGATGQTGPAGVAPLVAIFAPGKFTAKVGKKLKVPYALSEAATVTAKLVRKSTTLTKTVKGGAGANALTWKLTKGKKPLPTGKYRLSLSSQEGRTLTTITVKVLK